MTRTIEFQLQSPLVHGGFATRGRGQGNHTPIRRYPVLYGGEIVRIPALSGNSLRGVVRRQVMRELLRAMGNDVSSWVYSVLANGGALLRHDKGITPSRIREIRADCPALSVFGSAMGGWMLPGRVCVGMVWPYLIETAELTEIRNSRRPPLAEIEHEVSHVRMPDREYQDVDETDAKPMPHSMEVIAAGTTLQSAITFPPEATKVEQAVVWHGISQLTHIGAKSGSGMGRCKVLNNGDGSLWTDWVQDTTNLERCQDVLQTI